MKDDATMAHYSDETLMAFADGMLDEPLFSAVADAVDRDPALAARLEQLVDGASLARQGFEPLLQPVSPELEASVQAMMRRQGPKRTGTHGWSWAWLMPLSGAAALVAAVAIALPALQSPRGDGALLGGLDQSQLSAALDTIPSGADYMLEDGRRLHAVASFNDQDGALCREFEVPGYAMVACRQNAQWLVTMAVATSQTGDGYRTASGLVVIDAYLNQIGASAPILDTEEMTALGQR